MGRMNEDFLDKRSEGLVKWLEVLMSHDFFEKSLDIKKVQRHTVFAAVNIQLMSWGRVDCLQVLEGRPVRETAVIACIQAVVAQQGRQEIGPYAGLSDVQLSDVRLSV